MKKSEIAKDSELQYYFNASDKKKAEILYVALCYMESNCGIKSFDAIIYGVRQVTTVLPF